MPYRERSVKAIWRCRAQILTQRVTMHDTHRSRLIAITASVITHACNCLPLPTWKAFLSNYMKDLVAFNFFTVPTVILKVLLVFVILATIDKRREPNVFKAHDFKGYEISGSTG